MNNTTRTEEGFRSGRTYGMALFCNENGAELWREPIYRDDTGWKLKGRHLMTCITETFFECPEVKKVRLLVPAQDRVIYIEKVNGRPEFTHVEPYHREEARERHTAHYTDTNSGPLGTRRAN